MMKSGGIMDKSTLIFGLFALGALGSGLKAYQSYEKLNAYGQQMEQEHASHALTLTDIKQQIQSNMDMSLFMAPCHETIKTTQYYFKSADRQNETFTLKVDACAYDKNYQTDVLEFKGKTHTLKEWIALTGGDYSNFKRVEKAPVYVQGQYIKNLNTK